MAHNSPLEKKIPSLCRDCFSVFYNNKKCNDCGSPRLISHSELLKLKIAHIDCDAFYASIEKHENPKLRNLPVIVGGGHRGVVTTCCYIARINGVRSAMPMFMARKLCPSAIILAPRIGFYKEVSTSIKNKLMKLSPAIEFVSLDEAYIDLSGTSRLHQCPPAVMLAKVSAEIEYEFGITTSVGLSYNKFLSKIASELDKPRGFSVIGIEDLDKVLLKKPVSVISGVGGKTLSVLNNEGVLVIGDLIKYEKIELYNKFGAFGEQLWYSARGLDNRKIVPNKPAKSISLETTFKKNESSFEILRSHLWDLCEKISSRAKKSKLYASNIKLKLKTEKFKVVTGSFSLKKPTNSAAIIFQSMLILLKKNSHQGPFRLIGITLTKFSNSESNRWESNLFEQSKNEQESTEKAMDKIREKYGEAAIIKGLTIK